MSIEQELLTKFEGLKLSDANEAETRLKLIDRILFEVLGWTHDDVSVEERVQEDNETTYSDYIVRTAGSAFVVEAKKVGETFSDTPNVRKQRLNRSFVSGALGDAIKQARDYARKMSIPFAVVTNGAEWIIFPATRVDQVRFADSSASVFSSLSSVLGEDREEFAALLSRDAVISGSLATELVGRNEDQLDQRRLRLFFSNRGPAPRENPLYPLIENALVSAFTDSLVDGSADLLDRCYVSTADRIRFDKEIEMHLARRAPAFSKAPIRPLTKKDAGKVPKVIADAMSRVRPLAALVVGSVGAGKTTFIQHTRLVTCANIFEPQTSGPYPHWIYVDFRGFTAEQSPSEFIYRAIKDYMGSDHFFGDYSQCIRPAYSDEIRTMKSGPLKLIAEDEGKVNEKIADFLLQEHGSDDYIDRLLIYASSKAPVFLVVDNVDQLSTDELQAAVFGDAVALSHRNKLNLVIALRDATFTRHKSSAVFDAFDFNPIHIEPPPITAVLSKRFFLMKQLLKGESGTFISEGGATIKISDLSMVADLISSSVLGTNIGRVIDVLATSDVRLALRMTREFLESGYSNPGRAIEVFRSKGSYILPKHEAFRSVLLGREQVYSEELSIIGNPFDSRMGRTQDQMLRLFIVSALVSMSSRADFQYLNGKDIEETLCRLGFGEHTTLHVLEDLCRIRFVHTSAQSRATITANYRPTRLGGYLIRQLISDITFLEAMLMDTFIADKNVWSRLSGLSDKIDSERGDIVKRLELRQERISCFFDYMERLFLALIDEAKRRALPREWLGNPFDQQRHSLERHQKLALASARKNYGKKGS